MGVHWIATITCPILEAFSSAEFCNETAYLQNKQQISPGPAASMAHAGIVLFLFISIFMGSVQLLSIYQESSLMNILTLEALNVGQKGGCQRSLSGGCETPLFHLCLLVAHSFWGCCASGRLDQALTVNVFRPRGLLGSVRPLATCQQSSLTHLECQRLAKKSAASAAAAQITMLLPLD